VRARIAVVACRDRIAESLVDALSHSPHVELCERVSHDPERIEAAAFSRYDTVVCSPLHSGSASTGPDLTIAREVCARLASLPLHHAIVLGSAAVYSPNHQNAGLLDESTFIPEGRSDIADGWREVEACSAQIGERSGAAPPVRTILRAAAVLDGEDYFSRLLTGRVAITYPGHDPTIQLLSARDLAGAVAAVIEHRAGGIYNVAPAAGIPLKAALRVAGVPRLPLGRLAQNAVRTIASSASLSAPPDQLKYIQFSWTVSGDKLRRDTGFMPARTSEEAILELTGARAAATGGYDEFGMDAAYIRRYCRHLFHLLHDRYWRVEVDGIEHVPAQGRGVLVGMHRGFMPFDGVMALYALVTKRNRIPRFLIHPSLTKFPFLADFMAKLGGIMACQENGDWVLQRDELLGVFPEGIRGAFTMYDRAYTLGKFGRDEFVRMALRNHAPIYPFVTVGSAEIYPILKRVDWSWFKRYTEWPFLPITAAPFPLPSKWHTQFLPPMHIEQQYGPEAAENPKIVHRISLEVRQRMQAAIDEMLLRRKSIFYGTIFNRSTAAKSQPPDKPDSVDKVDKPSGSVAGV
jgi:1-acyl-sn-glycerol-3-phosphate acyltransferase/nucleoside-diphosphate-sugar epimerase